MTIYLHLKISLQKAYVICIFCLFSGASAKMPQNTNFQRNYDCSLMILIFYCVSHIASPMVNCFS